MPKDKKPAEPEFVNLQHSNVQVPGPGGRPIFVAPWANRNGPRQDLPFIVKGEHFARFVSAKGPLYPKPAEGRAGFRPGPVPTLGPVEPTLKPVGTLQPIVGGATLQPVPEEEAAPADAPPAAGTTPPSTDGDSAPGSDSAKTDAPADPVAAAFDGADADAAATADEDGLSPGEADLAPGQDAPKDNLSLLPNVGDELAGALINAGFPTYASIVEADPKVLEAVHGISLKGAKALQKAAAKAEKAKAKRPSLKDRARG